MSKTAKIYTDSNGDYLKNNPSWHVEDSPWKAKQIYKMLQHNPLKLNSIAEIGCGAGEILNQLHTLLPDHISYFGFDISIDAINLAKMREKERLKFRCENLLKSDEHFDLLIMMDVLEHVDDYIGFIRSCKPRASYTIFHIPLDLHVQGLFRDSPMRTRQAVGHLHYFTKNTAIATLKDCGFEIVDFFYTAGAVELSHGGVMNKIASVPRRLMFSINQDWAVTLLGGYSLLVLAK